MGEVAKHTQSPELIQITQVIEDTTRLNALPHETQEQVAT
jgi:hypothetical protein